MTIRFGRHPDGHRAGRAPILSLDLEGETDDFPRPSPLVPNKTTRSCIICKDACSAGASDPDSIEHRAWVRNRHADVGVPQLIGNGRKPGPTNAGASPRRTSLQDAVFKRSLFASLGFCKKPPRNGNWLQERVATLQTRDSSVLPTAAILIPGI
jgi:hypothetical protein